MGLHAAGAALLLVLAALLALQWRVATPPVSFGAPYVDDGFFHINTKVNQELNRPEQVGWQRLDDGWTPLRPSALLTFQLGHVPRQHIWLDVDFDRPPGGRGVFTVRQTRNGEPDRLTNWHDEHLRLRRVDLLQYIQRPGFVFLDFAVDGGVVPPGTRLIRNLRLTYENATPAVDWRVAGYFLVLMLTGYAALLWGVLPLAASGLRACMQATARVPHVWRIVVGVVALMAIGAVVVQPEFRKQKDFDDRAALGNALVLRDTGFATEHMFFRSRIRPALVAWMLPFATALPHQIVSSTYTPSDRLERIFYFYDRQGPQFGLRVFTEQAWFSRAVLLLAALALAGLAARGGSKAVGGLCALAIVFCFYRAEPNALSDAPTLLFSVLAFAMGLSAWRRGGAGHLLAGGLTMGFCILLKETTVLVITALLLTQGWEAWAAWRARVSSATATGHLRRLTGRFVGYWAAAAILPTLWYGAVLDTGFGEMAANTALTRYHGIYHQYTPLTWSSGVAEFTQVFGVLLALVPVGVWAAWRTGWRPGIDRAMLGWLFATGWVFTMDFLFPRFLVYVMPPLVYFAMRGAVWLGEAAMSRRAAPVMPPAN